jgi:ArsR family transcriptional regulator, arsenate/arsenite/antimonite-responsive transcriptional repressor
MESRLISAVKKSRGQRLIYFVLWRSITSMREFMAITKALADENRVRILLALGDRELCVCQLVEFCSLAPSTVSKHLSILYQAGLLESRKTERWVYYRLPTKHAPAVVRGALRWVTASLTRSTQFLEDENRVKTILKQDPKQLCQNQIKKSKCCSFAPEIPAAAKWLKAGRAT